MAKKTATIIFLLIPFVCFGQTTQTHTVGTASRNFSTIQACEDSKNGDQVSDNEIDVCECYKDTDFDEDVAINGGTNDATRYFVITVASSDRHDGTQNTGARIDRTNGTGAALIEVDDDFVRVLWLEGTGTADNSTFVVTGNGGTVSDSRLEFLLVYNLEKTGGGVHRALLKGREGSNHLIQNNILDDEDVTGDGSESNGIQFFGVDCDIINNTVYGCDANGITTSNGATGIIKNNISMGNGTDYVVDVAGTESFNMGSDTSPSGTGSLDSKTAADQFVNLTTDFHLKSGNDAEDAGNNTNAPADDIDEDSRPQNTTVDMGADEVVPAAAGRTFLIGMLRQQEVDLLEYFSFGMKRRECDEKVNIYFFNDSDVICF